MSWLPYARHQIDAADRSAVGAALDSAALTQGPGVDRFESALAETVGARYAVVFSNGTAALHAAYAAAGVGPGASVLTSPITFVATANAAMYLGGWVAFADVDPTTALIDPNTVDDCDDRNVRVVVPVHFGGEVADLWSLAAIAEARRWIVIEDAAHALGGRYRTSDGGEFQVGACAHSAMCCFSFHPAKHITTGEGGAVTTNDVALWRRLRRFRTHGITRDPEELEHSDGPWYYEQQELGFNYRLTDIQSALGLSQLAKLDRWQGQRARVAGWYEQRLAHHPGIVPLGRPRWSRGAHHLFVVRVDPALRRTGYEALVAAGIGANVHYIPVYRQPFYQRAGFAATVRPGAEAYYGSALTLPLFPAMTEGDVDRVVATLSGAVGSRR
ncbi:MAG: UDP-4-amino-4,6-dideoxy-N-acetyl-beta-L-altrosamine transaminase [Gemmatimonadales bacterium]